VSVLCPNGQGCQIASKAYCANHGCLRAGAARDKDRALKATSLTQAEREMLIEFIRLDRSERKGHLATVRRSRVFSGSLIYAMSFLEDV
jgi:hypothetical protein